MSLFIHKKVHRLLRSTLILIVLFKVGVEEIKDLTV